MNHISKKELKKADQLTVAGRNAFEQILKNQKMVLAVAIILFLAGAGYVTWDKTSLSKELSIQEEFYSVEKSYLKLKEGFDKAESDQKDKTAKEASKKELAKKDTDKADKTDATKDSKAEGDKLALPSGDLMKDYGSVVEGWNKLIDAHVSSKAAAMAALELSQLYLKYKSPKESLQVLSKVKNQQNSDHFLGAMVFHSYAKLLANQGQCQEAIIVWEGLGKKKNLGFLVEQAQMGRALCLETLGQTEKAEALYKDLAMGKETPMNPSKAAAPPKGKSQTQKTAEKYLRFMKITRHD
jgi:tetratricopeptide (TPR) repeat protein